MNKFLYSFSGFTIGISISLSKPFLFILGVLLFVLTCIKEYMKNKTY